MMTLDEFLRHVDVRGDNECWPWLGGRHGRGTHQYGSLGSGRLAHRASYRLHYGEPGRLHVLHRCDNPICVNPAHLFLGTQADNSRDMWAKGRGVSPPHPTGDGQADEIRASDESSSALARRFGVTTTRIRQIRRNQP